MTTGTESSISHVTVTESRIAADTYNSVTTIGTTDNAEERSSEQLVQDHEKGMVKSRGMDVWAVVV